MKKAGLLVAGGALMFVTGCVTQASAPSLAGTPGAADIRAEMQQQVNPAMLSIWDVTNNAMNEAGGIDASLMDTERWHQVAEGADKLAASGRRMAEATAYIAASPGNAEVGEGEVPMAAVQRHLDSDPRLFGQMAAAFAVHSEKLAAAARNRDPGAMGDLVIQMDGVCESCHARFWYPE